MNRVFSVDIVGSRRGRGMCSVCLSCDFFFWCWVCVGQGLGVCQSWCYLAVGLLCVPNVSVGDIHFCSLCIALGRFSHHLQTLSLYFLGGWYSSRGAVSQEHWELGEANSIEICTGQELSNFSYSQLIKLQSINCQSLSQTTMVGATSWWILRCVRQVSGHLHFPAGHPMNFLLSMVASHDFLFP